MSHNDIAVKLHSPGAVLDYSFDWGSTANGDPWLEATDSISLSSWQASPAGLALTLPSVLPGNIAMVFAGGGKAGVDYLLTNTITTAEGRTESRAMRLSCRVR